MAVDHTYELPGGPALVIAEVDDAACPVTSAPRLPARVRRPRAESRPLPVVAAPDAGGTQRRIAAHVAALVPDGATLQLGVGALSTAVGAALAGRRDLRGAVHTGR